jgi:hypothetical protein
MFLSVLTVSLFSNGQFELLNSILIILKHKFKMNENQFEFGSDYVCFLQLSGCTK